MQSAAEPAKQVEQCGTIILPAEVRTGVGPESDLLRLGRSTGASSSLSYESGRYIGEGVEITGCNEDRTAETSSGVVVDDLMEDANGDTNAVLDAFFTEAEDLRNGFRGGVGGDESNANKSKSESQDIRSGSGY